MRFQNFKDFCKKELKIIINDDALLKFEKYYELLVEWNQKFNLTAITEESQVIEKHFIDSLMMVKYIDISNKLLADIGSGAGFPGVPLAIVSPNTMVYLIEANNKRVSFLNEVVLKLNLQNVRIVAKRSEECNEYRETFDIVTGRAVKQLNILTEITLPLAQVDGYLIAYKGPNASEEIKESNHAFKELDAEVENNFAYELPFTNEKRNIVLIKKVKETKKKYPRIYSLIAQKPL